MWDVCFGNRVICGQGKISETAKEALQLGKKAFVVAYKNSRHREALIKLLDVLVLQYMPYILYEGIINDPDIHCIDEGAKLCLEQKCDVVIGIGGGSVLDASKAIAMLVTNGGSVREYQMGGKTITNSSLPLIAIPTTAGTGSEATKVAVISNLEENFKKSIAHANLIPKLAIIDASLMTSLSAKLTASTGMDALAHAMESYVSLWANPITEALGLKAIELIFKNIEKAVNEPLNIEARENMAIASYMAGLSLNAGVGIAHILGQPFGVIYKLSHGDAISIMLPVAIKMNLQYVPKKYAQIAAAIGMDCNGLEDIDAANKLLDEVIRLRSSIGAPCYLDEMCNNPQDLFLDTLNVIKRATMHIKCNPRELNEELVLESLNLALSNSEIKGSCFL